MIQRAHERFYVTHLRFALAMLLVGLLAGICFQESGRKVLITPALPVGAHLEYILGLAHGSMGLGLAILGLALARPLKGGRAS